MITRPMKAETVELNQLHLLRYPLMASPKLDGIRCCLHPQLGPVTQKFIPVPNTHVRTYLEQWKHLCLDGELVQWLSDESKPAEYNDTQSAIMSGGGQPEFRLLAFDSFSDPTAPFKVRYAAGVIDTLNHGRRPENILAVRQSIIMNAAELEAFYTEMLEEGHEGIILRSMDAPYKSGRSTLKQGWMLKLKPWADTEGVIIGFEERMHNTNENVGDALGLAKRSKSKDGLIPLGTLGALILDTRQWGVVKVGGGVGLNAVLRQKIWANRDAYVGKTVTFKYMPFGMKDKPRFPKYKGIRYD